MRELSLHILDALENSLEAGATAIELTIEEDMRADRLAITIRDNGRGMSKAQVDRIFDPFFTTRTTRHVGLGVPLFKAAAQRCNGDLTVTSQPGEGTTLQAIFQHSHIDRAPLGDIQGTLLAVILAAASDVPPHLVIPISVIPSEARNLTPSEARNLIRNIHYLHRVDGQEFEFSTADVRAELGDIPLTLPPVRKWLRKFIAEGEEKLSPLPAPVSGASLGEENLRRKSQ
jgi:Histidine kinase-, DNA gyrase B-, and HSP90-like ATPase